MAGQQLEESPTSHPRIRSPQVGLIDRLNRIVPEGLDSFFFTNSGSEVVDNAVKLARAATGRPNIICFEVRRGTCRPFCTRAHCNALRFRCCLFADVYTCPQQVL